MRTAVYRRKVFHASCLRTRFKKRCTRQKRLFFSNEINFCRHEISSFYLKLFLRTKVLNQNCKSKYLWFKSNRILGIIFILVWYLTLKTLCSVVRCAGSKMYFLFYLYLQNYLKSIFAEFVWYYCYCYYYYCYLILHVIAFASS